MKKTLALGFALLASIATSGLARASSWEIDGSHSSAQFSIKHLMVSNVRGEFSKVTGTLNLDDKDITKSSVDVSIDVNTINTREAKRDAHLKSPDFFDAAKFPALTFKSKKVEKAGADKLKVTLVRSTIDRPETQKRTVVGLGLRKLNSVSELADTPEVRGMINKISYLVRVL